MRNGTSKNIEWSKEDIQLIEKYYKKIPIKELSNMLSEKRTEKALRSRAQSLSSAHKYLKKIANKKGIIVTNPKPYITRHVMV